MARQYTTPTIQLRIDGHDLTGADVYVTFQSKGQVVTVEDADITACSHGTVIDVKLTQEQTAAFFPGEVVKVQVNWMDGDERYATDVATILWKENLLKEVLS